MDSRYYDQEVIEETDDTYVVRCIRKPVAMPYDNGLGTPAAEGILMLPKRHYPRYCKPEVR